MRLAHRLQRSVLAASLAAIAVAPPLLAQKRRPMTLIDLAELPRVIGPQLSPDGRTVAYFLSGADWKAGRLVFHLWRQDVAGGAPAQLTFTEGGDIPVVRWSPDGKTLLFLREGRSRCCRPTAANRASSPATRPASTPHRASTPTWSPDGTIVYFVAADPATAEERERNRVRDDVFAVDENYKRRHIWKIVVATGVETQITSGDTSVAEYKLSSDGRRIAVSARRRRCWRTPHGARCG
jgi:dipeptidyl aminopeptidase/acylaminoacyl peptidase